MLPGLSPEDDHRRVRARLETDGWKWLARGDWSQVYASPDGQQVARVVAFDPAYALHVRTCLANPGVAHFQRIDWHRDLAPAGQVVVMERLQPAAEAPASAADPPAEADSEPTAESAEPDEDLYKEVEEIRESESRIPST